jgi:pimeloyl-ACP methyl ester carboxylesterase
MPEEIKENETITQQVIETPNLIASHTLKVGQAEQPYPLHYVTSDSSHQPRPTVVFVHGTPGRWSAFARYFNHSDLRGSYRLIALDRPGWGESSYPEGDFPTRLERQSTLLGPLLKHLWTSNGQQPLILVGHSLGGSLAPILAADYPDYIRGVVILAGDVHPKMASARWYNTLLDWIPAIAVPDEWYYSNQEVLDLTESLEKAQAKLAGLTIPITVLQGTADELVDPANADFAKQLFQASSLEVQMIEKAGHLINLQHVPLVKAAIDGVARRSDLAR